jgi:hypothetical protein
MSACATHNRTDSTPYPSCLATRCTVPWSWPNSALRLRTIRTAAAFSSRVYRRVVGFPGVCSFGMTPTLPASPRPATPNTYKRFRRARLHHRAPACGRWITQASWVARRRPARPSERPSEPTAARPPGAGSSSPGRPPLATARASCRASLATDRGLVGDRLLDHVLDPAGAQAHPAAQVNSAWSSAPSRNGMRSARSRVTPLLE